MRPLTLLAMAAFATAAFTQQNLPPADVITINRVTTSGSGCPGLAVSTDISLDRTAVTLGFDEFQTTIGRGRRITDRERDCNVLVNLNYPGGYTFAVLEATYHGFAQLDSNVSGTFVSNYSFDSGNTSTTSTRADLTGGGAYTDGKIYTKHDLIPTENAVQSPCGGNVNMLLTLALTLSMSSRNDAAAGSMAEAATLALTQQVHIGWETCK